MSWTKEQEEIMIEAAKSGLTAEETSAEMIEAGYESRSVLSVKAKWRYMYKAPFGDFNEVDLTVEEIDEKIEEFTERIERIEDRKYRSHQLVLLGLVTIVLLGLEMGLWSI